MEEVLPIRTRLRLGISHNTPMQCPSLGRDLPTVTHPEIFKYLENAEF